MHHLADGTQAVWAGLLQRALLDGVDRVVDALERPVAAAEGLAAPRLVFQVGMGVADVMLILWIHRPVTGRVVTALELQLAGPTPLKHSIGGLVAIQELPSTVGVIG